MCFFPGLFVEIDFTLLPFSLRLQIGFVICHHILSILFKRLVDLIVYLLSVFCLPLFRTPHEGNPHHLIHFTGLAPVSKIYNHLIS